MTIYRDNANDLTKDLISIINKQTEVMLGDEKEITALKIQLQERDELIKEAIPYVYKVGQYCSDHWDINMGKWLEKAKKIGGEG